MSYLFGFTEVYEIKFDRSKVLMLGGQSIEKDEMFKEFRRQIEEQIAEKKQREEKMKKLEISSRRKKKEKTQPKTQQTPFFPVGLDEFPEPPEIDHQEKLPQIEADGVLELNEDDEDDEDIDLEFPELEEVKPEVNDEEED
jgi:hypothetical protein